LVIGWLTHSMVAVIINNRLHPWNVLTVDLWHSEQTHTW
jgi:hypothetical protein